MKLPKLGHFFSTIVTVHAHTTFVQLTAGGTTYPIGYAVRVPSYDGPIQDVTSSAMACNGNPNPTTPSSNIISVRAGETVSAVWRHTLTSTAANDPMYVIDPSHKGPTIAYLKKVDNAISDAGTGNGWFKIQQAGLDAKAQRWAITDLIAANGVHNIQIPSCIEDGQYLLRAEVIALHAAGSSGGAQLYMECAQLNITGGSGTVRPSTVSFPGAYSGRDPGILINIYQSLSSYTIPGPAVFTCPAGEAPSSAPSISEPVATPTAAAPTSTVISTTLSTSAALSSSSIVPVASSVPVVAVALYGQCGGIGWNGGTTCAAGATCKANGAYYSQCVPS